MILGPGHYSTDDLCWVPTELQSCKAGLILVFCQGQLAMIRDSSPGDSLHDNCHVYFSWPVCYNSFEREQSTKLGCFIIALKSVIFG